MTRPKDRVGTVENNRLVKSGRVKRCAKSHGLGRVVSGRVGSGQEVSRYHGPGQVTLPRPDPQKTPIILVTKVGVSLERSFWGAIIFRAKTYDRPSSSPRKRKGSQGDITEISGSLAPIVRDHNGGVVYMYVQTRRADGGFRVHERAAQEGRDRHCSMPDLSRKKRRGTPYLEDVFTAVST